MKLVRVFRQRKMGKREKDKTRVVVKWVMKHLLKGMTTTFTHPHEKKGEQEKSMIIHYFLNFDDYPILDSLLVRSKRLCFALITPALDKFYASANTI